MECRISQADSTIRSGQATEGDSHLYWFVRAVIAAAEGSDIARARQLAVLINPAYAAYQLGIQSSNPVLDPGADRRRYARLPMPISLGSPRVPSSLEARAAWWQNPFTAATAGAPRSMLSTCRM